MYEAKSSSRSNQHMGFPSDYIELVSALEDSITENHRLLNELQRERGINLELTRDRDDLASLVIDLENGISELDREFHLYKLIKRTPPASPQAGANVFEDEEPDSINLQNDLILSLESELRTVRRERADLFQENRVQSKTIEEHEELINSQQSEMMELSTRVQELERALNASGDSDKWKHATSTSASDRKSPDSPLIQKVIDLHNMMNILPRMFSFTLSDRSYSVEKGPPSRRTSYPKSLSYDKNR